MLRGLDPSQSRNFSLVTVANFFFFCNFSSFFLYPLYITHLGGTKSTIGFVMGSFGITSLGALPFVSVLIDRFGRRPFMTAGALTMLAASLSNLFIRDLTPAIFLPRIMQGLGFAMFFTSAATAAADFVPADRRGEGLGIFGASTIASYAVGPPVGEYVINHFGFAAFFVVSSSFSLVAFSLVALSSEPDVERESGTVGIDFFRLALSRRFAPLLATNLALAGGVGTYLNFIAPYLRWRGLEASWFFLIYSIAVTAVRILGGRLSDLFDKRRLVTPSLLVFSVCLGSIALITSLPVLVVVALGFSLSYGLLYPLLASLAMEKAGPHERGRAMGAMNACFSFGINFMSFGFGAVAEAVGFPLMYLAAAVVAFAGFVVFARWEAVGGG